MSKFKPTFSDILPDLFVVDTCPSKPGEAIKQAMTDPQIAEIVRNLKSDDIKDVRIT